MTIPSNPFSFTVRDFEELYLELKNKYPNKPDWFIILMSGLFDTAHWYLDARAQNLLLSSAFTEEAIRNLAAYLDYYPNNSSAGGGEINVTVPTGTYPVIIPKSQLKWEVVTSVGDTVLFEAVNDLTVNAGASGSVTVVQGTTVDPTSLGASDGITEFQEFTLPSLNVISDTVEVTVNSISWTRVETLANSSSTDKVFRVITKPNSVQVIQFGDGTFGAIPPAFDVLATYRLGGGTVGNIKARNTTVASGTLGSTDGVTPSYQFQIENSDVVISTVVVHVAGYPWARVGDFSGSTNVSKDYTISRVSSGGIFVNFGDGVNGEIPSGTAVISYIRGDSSTLTYSGGNADILSSFLNDDFSGGTEKESIEKARTLAPVMVRTNYRAVTEVDYEALSEKYSAAVIKAKCLPGYYGANTVGLHLIPAGGGLPSSSLKAQIETYLRDRSTLGSVDVRVRNPIYSTLNISLAIKMRPGYSFATYQQYATLVLRLLASEVTTEIVQIYRAEGIVEAVSYINDKWSYGFTSVDYPEITRIILRRIKEGVTLWGAGITLNDISSVVDDLTGVQSVQTPTLPIANLAYDFDTVTTDGTMTVIQYT